MITFATLFLGLCFGVLDVEVVTADAVASVQIVLDGRVVGQLDERPWKTTVDFGMRLAPHELLAVARDANGKELGRVRQWVNRARADSIVDALLADWRRHVGEGAPSDDTTILVVKRPLF